MDDFDAPHRPNRATARYRRHDGGPDPLAPPIDPTAALHRIAEEVMAGMSPRAALREHLRRGGQGPGLDELQRRVSERRQSLLERHRLTATVQQARDLLDRAVLAERKQLARDLDDDARFAELQLDALPSGTAAAVRELATYPWRSTEAREAYHQLTELLGQELLDQRFSGLKEALRSAGPAEREAVREMVAALNDLLAAHARGDDTTRQFAEFLARYGDLLGGEPESVEELIDLLAARSAAAARMRNSLTPVQREELDTLAGQAFGSPGLMDQLSRLDDQLQQLRPGQDWHGAEQFGGEQELGWGEAAGVLQDLATLDDLAEQLAQHHAGASLSDVDLDALEGQLGPEARLDAAALKDLERSLLSSELFTVDPQGGLQLTPQALRQLGQSLVRDAVTRLGRHSGQRLTRHHGLGGDPTGASRAWGFGDTEPWDVARTLGNAALRRASDPSARALAIEDIEVQETEARTRAAVALLVDTSFSMAAEGRWVPMKRTALALHHLVSTRFRNDALAMITFGRDALATEIGTLTGLPPHHEQGTNLHHGLLLAHRFFAREAPAHPVLLIVTDGEPTAHLADDGVPEFNYPPTSETLQRTVHELDRISRLGTTTTFFRLGQDQGLARFLQGLAQRCGGTVIAPTLDDLGSAVIGQFLATEFGSTEPFRP